MSLEKAIENLTAAIDRHTAVLTALTKADLTAPVVKAEQAKTAAKSQPQPAASKAQPAPQPQPKPEPTPAPAPKKAEQKLDRAAIGQRNLSLARAGKMPELKALFVKFGIDNFKDLPDARLADWCAELDKLEA